MKNLAHITPDPSSETAAKPLRVVVCGEVNSGKSTVINAILKGRVLPDFFGEKTRPFIHVRHGAEPSVTARFAAGREEQLDAMSSDVLKEAEACELVTDAAHLEGFEIIEMPFLNERDIRDDQIAFVESADLLVWTTIASQAWRLSEKSILDRCEKRPEAAVLVVSRADKLRSDEDREKLRSRVERETVDYFRSIVMMRGKDVVIDASSADEEAWIDTAAPELLQRLQELGTEVRAAQADALAAVAALAEANEDPAEFLDADPQSAKIVPLHETAEPVSTGLVQAIALARSTEPSSEAGPIEISTASTQPISDAARSKLADLMPALHGCDAVGIAPLGDEGTVEFLKGGAEDWSEIVSACQAMYRAESRLDLDAAGEPLQSHLSLTRHQVITQSYPRRGFALFMIAPTARMNHGIARTAFTRLTKALEQAR